MTANDTPPDQAAAAPTPPADRYYAVVLTDDVAVPEFHEFALQEELITYLASLFHDHVPYRLYVFSGARLPVSKGPRRHLIVPGSDPVLIGNDATAHDDEPDDDLG
jgi:hypothetical protein